MKCDCEDWAENIDKINGPMILQAVRSGFKVQYTGPKFLFCPWCGKELTEEEDEH